jgi:hypothetical protein
MRRAVLIGLTVALTVLGAVGVAGLSSSAGPMGGTQTGTVRVADCGGC